MNNKIINLPYVPSITIIIITTATTTTIIIIIEFTLATVILKHAEDQGKRKR